MPRSGSLLACVALPLCLLALTAAPSSAQASHHTPGAGVPAVSAPPPPKPVPATDNFVGDAVCVTCHKEVATSYAQTAHHLTSQPASTTSIHGSFAPGANLLTTGNPSLTFHMTADAEAFHQTAVDALAPGQEVTLSEPIDVVVGSGRKAQTYLYWKADQLFELPVSFWVQTGAWINSPGYTDGAIRFDRPIYPRCLECHAGSFRSEAPPANKYSKADFVPGITCERCHGPAGAHTAFYRQHPQSPGNPPPVPQDPAARMLHLASLPRQRQIDGCALCHAGLGKPLAPALSFKPGEPLDRYLQLPPSDPSAMLDVHGNQTGLLERSRCFQKSDMTCTTCHNVHVQQRDPAAFSAVCLRCHQAGQCGQFHVAGQAILTRCVECHMPLRRSSMLFSDTGDRTLQLLVRDHRIAVYKQAEDEKASSNTSGSR